MKQCPQTILLTDDDEAMCQLVRATLEHDGCRVLEANDGKTALDLVKQHEVDLVLLDWMMEGMSGIEVARALRNTPRTADIPIIMLTARGSETAKSAGREAGVAAYLVKPFSPLELIKCMEDAMTGREADRKQVKRSDVDNAE